MNDPAATLRQGLERATSMATRVGAAVFVLTFAAVATQEAGLIGASVGRALSMLSVLGALAWALKGPERMWRLGLLYLWLAFIVSIYSIQLVADRVTAWTGWQGFDAFRLVAGVHMLLVGAALGVVAAQRDGGRAPCARPSSRSAAALLVVGASVFWVGARTFPGTALDRVQANPAGHRWTTIAFLLATVVTLAALALLTLTLREAGDRVWSALGLIVFAFGSVFWVLHLAFRLTVLVQAAQAASLTSAAPEWFEPWRSWAALLFGIYSVLAYVGLAAYGAALLATGWLPRWIGWTCVLAGFLAAPLGGLPLFIHVPLWLVGLLELDRSRSNVG